MKTMQNRDQNQINPGHAERKRICILLGALLLLLGLSFQPGSPVMSGAKADTVTYVDEHGNEQTATDVIQLGESRDFKKTWSDGELLYKTIRSLHSGWYWVNKDKKVVSTINIEESNTVNLIIPDGYELIALDGFNVKTNATLIIWGQTNGSGRLTSGEIKGGKGNFIINSGTVNATANETNDGIFGKNIVINGGTVEATSKYKSGIDINTGGTLTINGGKVKAIGGKGHPGINGKNIVINSGTVKAQGGKWGAGIGGAYTKPGGKVIISGGHVTATAGENGQAIGHGYKATDSGFLFLGDELRVKSDDTVSYNERITRCRDHEVEIISCQTHEADQYGICRYCGYYDKLSPISYVNTAGTEFICSNWNPVLENSSDWAEGWYAVSSNVTVPERIDVTGAVNLILFDDVTLNAAKGIHAPEGASLTIWQQSGGTGTLTVNDPDKHQAGIGGNNDENAGMITVNGGNISSEGGSNAAGIGGGGHAAGGNIVINGGRVSAIANGGAGIGGGFEGSGGNITINGGIVIADGGTFGAGIGGGSEGSGGNVTINGGKVSATSNNGAGIGGGKSGDGGTIRLLGGQITATSKWGYSIGPGVGSDNDNFDDDGNPVPSEDGTPGPVTLSWNSPTDYINAATIVASSYTLEKPFLYSRNGETVGEVTAENLPAKETGDILVPNAKADAGVSIGAVDQPLVVEETLALSAAVTAAGENGGWTWSSETPEVATVDGNGVVTAVGEGVTQITAVYDSATTYGEATIALTVVDYHTIDLYATNCNNAEVLVGATGVSTIEALPGDQVRLVFTPVTDYTFESLYITCGSEEVTAVRVTEGDDTAWRFEMPAGDVYASAFFIPPEVDMYAAVFLNFNGEYMENLQQSFHPQGETPEYTGSDAPQRASTDQYTYTFSAWDPVPGPIEADTRYVATYTETLRNYPVTFQNWDGTVLQTGDVAYGATPAYTGETPVRPEDEQWVYRFSGWTPKIVPATGEAVYTAEYEPMQRLKAGPNTVSLQEYETVTCSFTPEEDSYYRFTSGVCEAHPIIRIYEKDGEDPIARDVDWRGGEHTFDCLAELTGGQEYRIEIVSIYGDAELTVNVAQGEVYGITVDSNIENGVIFDCLDEAYVGRQVVVGTEAAEGYMLEELVVTDKDFHEIDTERDMFTMPASPVTVSARFAPAIPIILDLEEPISVSGYGIGVEGLMTFPEGDDSGILFVWALEGFEIEMAFETGQDGVEIGSVTVTGADGTDVYCSVWQEDDSSMPVYRFIMPEEPVIVQVRAAQEYPEFGTANFILPEDTEIVEENAFEGDLAITSAEIPYGCERIGNYAFRNCTNLNKIRIPNICEIGTDAFDGCTLVYIYGEAGSPADLYCRLHDNCVFVEE